MSTIQSRSKELLKRIYDLDYYTNTLHRIADRHKVTLTAYAFDNLDDEFIVNFWNDFWFALPDSPYIRREPFFALCDLCEEIFE